MTSTRQRRQRRGYCSPPSAFSTCAGIAPTHSKANTSGHSTFNTRRSASPVPRGWRPCPKPGCPEPTPPSQRYCDEHLAEYEQARGTKADRGYGKQFQSDRKAWVRIIAQGGVTCWRCYKPLLPGQPFHLGHDDEDRSIIRGPECPPCNLRAAGKASHRHDPGPLPPSPPPF